MGPIIPAGGKLIASAALGALVLINGISSMLSSTTEEQLQQLEQPVSAIEMRMEQKVSQSKSEKMRQMYDEGKSVSEIAKELGVRYQFVYQVIDKHTKGNMRKDKSSTPSKSETFRQMYDEGYTIGEIAEKTGSNYTFVFNVIKKYRGQHDNPGNIKH